MRLAIWDDKNEVVASFDNDKLMLFKPLDKDVASFYLFRLMLKFMAEGGGASYGGPLTGGADGRDAGGDYAEAPGP
jgi:hypothetical protein